MPVVLDQGLHLGERVLQGALVDVPQYDGGQGAFVLWRQRHVGTGHGNGSWHAQLPDSPCRRRAGLLRHSFATSLRDYLSTVSTAL
ncbi:hypothetical protein GCM10010384_01710 [Streptomyces djakartensis]|uniref:Uncharacterized protein n=1 Tax=Streptomyces djakartensis TaxID=68193 RepID=A0ABQ2Z555_9ACTN|nr:hypothetical protein GCM10010384_01710 [Streptomyces djakartensis]